MELLTFKLKDEEKTENICAYCSATAEYYCKVKGRFLCEDCREHHLHNIQEYILEVWNNLLKCINLF